MVDTLGLLWSRQVTQASGSDQAGFRALLLQALPWLRRVVHFYADRGYQGMPSLVVSATGGRATMSLVRKPEGQKGFAAQPHRWIVERSIAWLNWSRVLSKDYEQTTKSSEAWIDLSAIRTALRKLHR